MDPTGRHHSSQKDRGGGGLSHQPCLPPAGLLILVENATKSRYGPLLGALATLAWVCFLRAGEVATIRVADIALPGAMQLLEQQNWGRGVHHQTHVQVRGPSTRMDPRHCGLMWQEV